MFGFALRVVLVAGSLVTLVFILLRVRASKVQIKDAIFWILFALLLLIISIFPGITTFFSNLLQIQSPINFVYLVIIFVLLIRLFTSSLRISQLDSKLEQLAQRVALNEKAQKEEPGQPATEEEQKKG